MKTPIYSGIITNYVCTAACRHCMFASSPKRPKDFITPEMSEHLAALLEKAGTDSVHIGGGEPFMNFEALCSLIEALNRHGIGVDYIETNAFWCGDDDFTRARLLRLRSLGVRTVMASVDPFHVEFVPLERPIRLCRLLRECGMDYFIWKERYLRTLRALDPARSHSHSELKAHLGENYVADTAAEYGVGMNGRSLHIAYDLYKCRPAEELLTAAPCDSLGKTEHCHLDLYGDLVPSRCPGIAAEAEDYLTGRITPQKYPVLARLMHGGIRELYAYACSLGFTPEEGGYPTKCALCYAIRKYLLEAAPSADIAPACYYEAMEREPK